MSDLDAGILRRALPGWVPEVRYLPVTDSTNRQAVGWAGEGAAHGSVVVADYQTEGRGRLDRRWVAPAGSSLLFSVVLRPPWEPRHHPLLPLAAAVAVCRCLKDCGVEARVKWPNDVLLGDQKVCGILAEASDAVVLGVGLNVKQTSFPDPIRLSATSLESSTGRTFSRSRLLGSVVAHLASLVDGPAEVIPELYRPWCQTVGLRVRLEVAGQTIEATATGIDATGGLVLESGCVARAGDVVHLR